MKTFIIGVAFAYNPFEIQNEIPDCFEQCGGIGGKCEEICGPSKSYFEILMGGGVIIESTSAPLRE